MSSPTSVVQVPNARTGRGDPNARPTTVWCCAVVVLTALAGRSRSAFDQGVEEMSAGAGTTYVPCASVFDFHAPADDTAVADGRCRDAPGVRHLDVNVTAIPCPEGYHNRQEDNICLACNGRIPGPAWVFHAGERVHNGRSLRPMAALPIMLVQE